MQFQEKFIQGAISNGVPETVAAKIWNDWLDLLNMLLIKVMPLVMPWSLIEPAWLKALSS